MDNANSPDQHDNPFEWLGRGVDMDRSSHGGQQPENSVPVHDSMSNPTKFGNLNEATDEDDDDPFKMLGRPTLMDQSTNLTGQVHEAAPSITVSAATPVQSNITRKGSPINQSANTINKEHEPTSNFNNTNTTPVQSKIMRRSNSDDDPFEMLAANISSNKPTSDVMLQQAQNETIDPSFPSEPEPKQENDILVEDVMSVDENALDISDVASLDRSFVVQELFPSTKSLSPAAIPSTIHEDKSNTDAPIQQQQQQHQQQENQQAPAAGAGAPSTICNQQAFLPSPEELAESGPSSTIYNDYSSPDLQQKQQDHTYSSAMYNSYSASNVVGCPQQYQQEVLPTVNAPLPSTIHQNYSAPASQPQQNQVHVGASDETNQVNHVGTTLAYEGFNNNFKMTSDVAQNGLAYQYQQEMAPSALISQSVQNQSLASSETGGCNNGTDLNQQPGLQNEDSNVLLSFNQTPSTSDAATLAKQVSASDSEQFADSVDADLLQLPTGATELTVSSLERNEQLTSPLYNAPPEIAAPRRDSVLSFGLPMGTPCPATNDTIPDRISVEIAPPNPGADATVATALTAASTNIEYDSDSDESDLIMQHQTTPAEGKPKRQTEESYALFNDDSINPGLTVVNATSEDDGSLDCREEFLMATKKRRKSSNKQADTPIVSDEEVLVMPGMVAYTGFDEDDEMGGSKKKKSASKISYKKLPVSTKPSTTKKLFIVSILIIIALIVVISVLIAVVTKRIESTAVDTVEIDEDPANQSDLNTTVSGESDSEVAVEESTPTSLPITSSTPSSSLVETAFDDVALSPSSSPTYFPTISPSIKPTTLSPSNSPITSTYAPSTSHPSAGEISSAPSIEVTFSSTDTTEAPSYNPSSANPTMTPTIMPSSDQLTSSTDSSFICDSSDMPIDISELPLLYSADEPCAHFIVELCFDDLDKGSNWAIVYYAKNSVPANDLESIDSTNDYDDDGYDDDDFYDDDLLFDDDRTTDNETNVSRPRRNAIRSQPTISTIKDQTNGPRERPDHLDEDFPISGNQSSIVCLQKGSYHFIIHDSSNVHSYALQFGNGRPVRPMMIGNYTNNIEVTEIEVTDFDVMGISSNLTAVPLSISQSDASPNHESYSTSLVTSSGTDLVYDISKAYGILFDVEAGESAVTITSMEIYLDTSFPTRYEVHTKEGSWKNYEILTGFHLVAHGNIQGRGVCHDLDGCAFSQIPSKNFESVFLPSMTRKSFYVTLTTDDLVYQHLKVGSGGIDYVDVEQASSSDLTVYLGASVLEYPLELADPTTDFRPGGFIGRLIYDVDSPVELAPDDTESTSQGDEECYYYTEESCRKAAIELGLSVGGAGYHFSGQYEYHGCYFYRCSNCVYGGRAYFGKSPDKFAMELPVDYRSVRRLDCTTKIENMHKETSFWCLFPSNICSAC